MIVCWLILIYGMKFDLQDDSPIEEQCARVLEEEPFYNRKAKDWLFPGLIATGIALVIQPIIAALLASCFSLCFDPTGEACSIACFISCCLGEPLTFQFATANDDVLGLF